MTSSITVEPYETVEFSESDTDSWQVVDPFDSENDDVITTESDVISSDEDVDVDDEEEEDGDVDVVVDDVIPSESDVISSEYDEDEDEEEDDDEEDDVISSEEEEEEEEDEDDVITSEDEEEEYEDDVITPMSSDEMTNRTQELNKAVVEFDGPYNVEFSDSMKVDAYFERSQLEHMLYEEAMKEDAYIKRMQLERMLYEDDVEEEEHVEDEDEDDYDEDLDDELIPRWLNNKFERQRMRKLGKKVYPKMKKSKRMVNQYNRPGCAGAKHGLGLKHNLIG